ncbi:hypothetical protein ACLB2K_000155 [Fragaria x ananassa]
MPEAPKNATTSISLLLTCLAILVHQNKIFWTWTCCLEETAEKKRIWKSLLTCIRSHPSITVCWGRKCSFVDKHCGKHPLLTCAAHTCSSYGMACAQFLCPSLRYFLQTHTGKSCQKLPR